MKCPQCENTLVEPRDSDKYCETCGFPDENRCEFSLVEIKAYLRSMFQKQNCGDDVRLENHSLSCAYNLLTDEKNGLVKFCDDGGADGLGFDSFTHAEM